MDRIKRCCAGMLLLFVFGTAGCGNNSSANAETEKKLKESFTNTQFDINKVPPAQRARVQALMGANSAASRDGSKSAPPGPTAKP